MVTILVMSSRRYALLSLKHLKTTQTSGKAGDAAPSPTEVVHCHMDLLIITSNWLYGKASF